MVRAVAEMLPSQARNASSSSWRRASSPGDRSAAALGLGLGLVGLGWAPISRFQVRVVEFTLQLVGTVFGFALGARLFCQLVGKVRAGLCLAVGFVELFAQVAEFRFVLLLVGFKRCYAVLLFLGAAVVFRRAEHQHAADARG
jgi:hypothetical protein